MVCRLGLRLLMILRMVLKVLNNPKVGENICLSLGPKYRCIRQRIFLYLQGFVVLLKSEACMELPLPALQPFHIKWHALLLHHRVTKQPDAGYDDTTCHFFALLLKSNQLGLSYHALP